MQEHESPCSKLQVLEEGVNNFKDECGRDFARLENTDRTLGGDMNGIAKNLGDKLDVMNTSMNDFKTSFQKWLIGILVLVVMLMAGLVLNYFKPEARTWAKTPGVEVPR